LTNNIVLQRQHVGADERFHHVEDARVQEEALVDLQPPMQHVDAQQPIEASLGGLVVGAECRRVRHLDPAGEQLVDVAQELLDLVDRHEPPDDQIALRPIAQVLIHGEGAAVIPSSRGDWGRG
jgi:hypothetical protein